MWFTNGGIETPAVSVRLGTVLLERVKEIQSHESI